MDKDQVREHKHSRWGEVGDSKRLAMGMSSETVSYVAEMECKSDRSAGNNSPR